MQVTKSNIALIIGAGSESIFAIETAKKLGLYTIAFDGNPDAKGLKLADESHVVDIRTPEPIIKKLGNRIPKLVVPIPIGRYLITTGAINDYYGLIGCNKEATNSCTDKYLFHNILCQQKLRNISCKLLKQGNKIDENELKFPLIIKPRYGSGSRDVAAIFSKEEFIEKISPKLPFDEDFIIEDLVEGNEYGVDAAVIDNKFHLVLVRKKINTPFPYRQSIGYYSQVNIDETKLLKYLTAVTNSLKINNSLLNFDLILKDDGEIFVIELAPRPSGYNLHNLFTIQASGIDMLREYLNYISGKEYNFDNKKNRQLLMKFFDFQNCIVEKAPDFNAIAKKYNIIDYKYNIDKEKLSVVKDGQSIIGRGYVILEGKDENELSTNCAKLMQEFKLQET